MVTFYGRLCVRHALKSALGDGRMSSAQVTNLSLLSRGVGEVQLGLHEKIEVKLEPEVRDSLICLCYTRLLTVV